VPSDCGRVELVRARVAERIARWNRPSLSLGCHLPKGFGETTLTGQGEGARSGCRGRESPDLTRGEGPEETLPRLPMSSAP
jgi:hypothetical protein